MEEPVDLKKSGGIKHLGGHGKKGGGVKGDCPIENPHFYHLYQLSRSGFFNFKIVLKAKKNCLKAAVHIHFGVLI